MRRLILRSFQSPGDLVMLTAAVRDLHLAYPGQFETDVRTSTEALWQHNRWLTRLQEGQPGVEILDMHYPLIHQSNDRPYHFIHGYIQYLEQQLQLRIPVTKFQGDVHLSEAERQAARPFADLGVPEHYWILMAGGKYDFTAKWWNPASYQAVVDHFRGQLTFVQCGEANHWHPQLSGVVNLIGQTSTRDFIRLMYHADGVVCPVTFAMHLAAAVETRPGRPRHRPCVVIAGGREPAHWEAYPHHQFLSTNGLLACCQHGGCWKSRCQLVGDGDPKDTHDLCEQPVQVQNDLRIPKCLHLITPDDVIRRIDLYYSGGLMQYSHGNGNGRPHGHLQPVGIAPPAHSPLPAPPVAPPAPARRILLEFRHGLGDAVQFTSVLRHLQAIHPDRQVDIAVQPGKHSAFRGLCHQTYLLDRDPFDRARYDEFKSVEWHECRQAYADAPSTKVSRCLKELFGIEPRPELCRYAIARSAEADERARAYLREICPAGPAAGPPAGPNAHGRFPAVLIHYEGNTSSEKKNLGHELIREVCETLIALNRVPVILDWDRRSPLVDQQRIFNPDQDHPLWQGLGTGDAETLASLIEQSELMIGVDSGPLHVAGATTTPTLAVWTQHHPVHYFDLAENVTHFVPGDYAGRALGPAAQEYFETHYLHETYKSLPVDLPAFVETLLTGEAFERTSNRRFLRQLTSTAYNARYYEEHKLAGLDYLDYGAWQQEYGRWFTEVLGLKGRRVLDVGCACGSILRGLGEAGAIVQGVEINEYMVQLGRSKWPDMASLLHVCDAVNLHLFGDSSWDAIHSAQVAEHWKPALVPHILAEFQRVVAPGGLLFCALDTEELFARQGRTLEHEDPTHICIRPMSWWHEQLTAAGWQVCTEDFAPALLEHPLSFTKRYDWDWFLARRL